MASLAQHDTSPEERTTASTTSTETGTTTGHLDPTQSSVEFAVERVVLVENKVRAEGEVPFVRQDG